uniref:Uncharacterized protein n=1 Tax=Nelumbo nucifera TaxID=4432 RepID=A0A822ZSZ2_NELNU|nr:TPA_asm: hypothetical protein HUJ06_016430 [Nelumbo nucifera]
MLTLGQFYLKAAHLKSKNQTIHIGVITEAKKKTLVSLLTSSFCHFLSMQRICKFMFTI